jgi:predicted transcriptional regulator of viral defense system
VKIDLAFEQIIAEDASKIAYCRQELFQIFLILWIKKEYKNEKLSGIGTYQNAESRFYHICKDLVSKKVIFGFNHSTKGYSFFIKNSDKSFTLEQISCAIYPYGYVSFLTAMNLYQLSNIKSSAIYYTTFNRQKWKTISVKEFINNFNKIGLSFKKEADDFEYLKKEDPEAYDYLFSSRQINFKTIDSNRLYSYQSVIPSYPVEDPFSELFKNSDFSKSLIVHTKKTLDEHEWWGNVRLQNINDLFLDMLRYPQYCGGLTHVLEVYKNHIEKYLDDVITTIMVNGTLMDKARFGFFLEKCLNHKSQILEDWKKEQVDKRGGSRKLVSTLDFDQTFDPDWNISINHDEFKKFI